MQTQERVQNPQDLLMYLIENSRFRPLRDELLKLGLSEVQSLLLGEEVPELNQLKQRLLPLNRKMFQLLCSRLRDLSCLTAFSARPNMDVLLLKLVNSDIKLSKLSKEDNREKIIKALEPLKPEEGEQEFILASLVDSNDLFQSSSSISSGFGQVDVDDSNLGEIILKFTSAEEGLCSTIPFKSEAQNTILSFQIFQPKPLNINFKEEHFTGIYHEKQHDVNGYSNTFDQTLIEETAKTLYHPDGPSYTEDIKVSDDPRYKYRGIKPLYKKKL